MLTGHLKLSADGSPIRGSSAGKSRGGMLCQRSKVGRKWLPFLFPFGNRVGGNHGSHVVSIRPNGQPKGTYDVSSLPISVPANTDRQKAKKGDEREAGLPQRRLNLWGPCRRVVGHATTGPLDYWTTRPLDHWGLCRCHYPIRRDRGTRRDSVPIRRCRAAGSSRGSWSRVGQSHGSWNGGRAALAEVDTGRLSCSEARRRLLLRLGHVQRRPTDVASAYECGRDGGRRESE